MATNWSNRAKLEMLKATVDLDTDVVKGILMASGYSFNPATHEKYADVSASEHATASGYTAGGNTLAGIALSQDDTNAMGIAAWNNTSWTASGGNITAAGMIIFDDTTTVPADLILGYIDFGSDQTVLDGGTFTVANIKFRIKG